MADRAKVTKGALYFHFPSKEDLARAVITEQHSFVSAQNEELLKQGFPPLESMILMCRRFAANLLTEPMVRAGSRLTLEASSFDEDVRQPYEDWIALMGRLAREAQQRGELRGDLDPDSLARFVVSSLTGVHIVSAVLTDRADLLRRVDEMWAMLLPGVVSDDVRDTSRELIRKTTGA